MFVNKWIYLLFLLSCTLVCRCQIRSDSIEFQNEIICVSPTSAQFPGGIDSLQLFYKSYLRWPSEFCGEGTEVVHFTILKNGKITDIKIKKSICKQCDEEVIRLVKLMPNWIPAYQNGKPVIRGIHLPIKFRLE